MKYKRITMREFAGITGDATYNRLAELEDKIESGELISTVQDERGEQETAFFLKHDAKVCKEVVKECLQILRDMRLFCIHGYYSSGWNECIDTAIEQLTDRYSIDEEDEK